MSSLFGGVCSNMGEVLACPPSTVAVLSLLLIRQLQPRLRVGRAPQRAAVALPSSGSFQNRLLHLGMNKSGALWELLRFCLLLYDQSSKLNASEAASDVDCGCGSA